LFQVDPQAYFFGALLFLLLPLNWLLAALFAAVFHELCHILALKLQGGSIRSIHVHWNGCVIEVERIEEHDPFFSILAGPLGSLTLLFLCRIAPKIAVCGLIQGMYNLIPLMPLDGGRLLRDILYCFAPERAENIMRATEVFLRIGIMIGILFLLFSQALHPFPGIILVIWNIRLSLRKIPCKPSKIGLQ